MDPGGVAKALARRVWHPQEHAPLALLRNPAPVGEQGAQILADLEDPLAQARQGADGAAPEIVPDDRDDQIGPSGAQIGDLLGIEREGSFQLFGVKGHGVSGAYGAMWRNSTFMTSVLQGV
jgi:hypothetical protein